MACVKHYACNSMENARFTVDVRADARALREVYLPHFRACVQEGVASVMSAYNSVNGEWCGQNRMLLTDILKKEMGFDGFTITDFIFGMRDSKKAALAGQDTEMPFAMYFNRDLKGLVERGEVPLERIDDAVLRKLRQLVRFGQGRDPGAYGREVVGSAEHRQLALEVARKSIVLLKNEGGLLPLDKSKLHSLAVIGPNAAPIRLGGYSGNPGCSVSVLEGIRQKVGSDIEVLYAEGCGLTQSTNDSGQMWHDDEALPPDPASPPEPERSRGLPGPAMPRSMWPRSVKANGRYWLASANGRKTWWEQIFCRS